MDKNYLEIVAKNILSDVKDKLKRNYVVLEEKQEKETDKKMIEIIKSVIEKNIKLYKVVKKKKIKNLIIIL